MRFVAADTALGIAQGYGLSPKWGPDSQALLERANVRFEFFWREKPTVAVALARCLCTMLLPFDACMLLVSEYGVWPSSEDLNLYQRFCEAHGGRGDLVSAPGHLVAGDELDDLISLLHLVLTFGWDAVIVPDRSDAGEIAVFVSHDEFIRIESTHTIDQAIDILSKFGFEIDPV